jgi:8-oxo-dGTP pyrophosphatase MutT (NUDIX family)
MVAEPATPRPAATVILLRRGGKHSDRGLEVLMLRRGAQARFMPGVWVFAGGAVDPVDREWATAAESDVDPDELAHRACAARELAEEAGVSIEPETLLPWSRWVTPEQVSIRFDTRFYVGLAPAHCIPVPDMTEMDEARWVSAEQALADHAQGNFELPFPTLKHMEELGRFADADEVLANAAKRPVIPLTPRVVGTEDSFTIILPGEPGYDD